MPAIATISTITAAPVDATEAPWTITDEDVFGVNAAILRHEFTPRVDETAGTTHVRRVEYLLPRRALPVDFAGEQALVNVDPAAVVRWATFEDHVKADVVFTAKPAVLELWFALNLLGVTAEQTDTGSLLLLDDTTGGLVGVLPRPFLRDSLGFVHECDWELGDGCLTVSLPDLGAEQWLGAVFDPTTIDTTTVATGTGQGSQRTIVRLSTGMLVMVLGATSTNAEFWYSSDNGATWTQYTSGTSDIAGATQPSIAAVTIGSTEYLVVAWKQSGTGGSPARTDGYLYVNVGAFNAGRTTLSWSTAVAIVASNASYNPALVVHGEGTGAMAHILHSFTDLSSYTYALRARVTISSSGVPTATQTALTAGGDYGNANPTMPSTCLDTATKNFWGVWSAGATGSGKGIRARLHTYSAGSWTAGTERELSSTDYAASGRISACFDGTRLVVAYAKSTSTSVIEVLERDAGDTTTTSRTPPALSDGTVENVAVTYDTNGNIYLFASGATSQDAKYVKYDRTGAAWGSWTTLEATTVRPDSMSAKLSSSSNYIEVVYATGPSSPYNARYGSIFLNTAPTAPTWDTTAGPKDINASLALDWTFTDPDAGDTQSAYALKRDIGGTVRWWNGSSFGATVETWTTDTATILTLASGWGADSDANHNYYVATKDASGAGGTSPAYSTALVITPSAKVAPTLDTPAAAAVVGSSTLDAAWTVAQQSAYLLELLDAAGTTVLWTAGGVPGAYVVDTVARTRTIGYTLANGTSYKVRLTTKNTEGLASTAVTHAFSVSYTAPATATATLNVVDDPGYITVTCTNPAPTGSQPVVDHLELYRRTVGDTSAGGLVIGAENVANNGSFTDRKVGHYEDLEYRWLVVGVNGTTSWTPWVN